MTMVSEDKYVLTGKGTVYIFKEIPEDQRQRFEIGKSIVFIYKKRKIRGIIAGIERYAVNESHMLYWSPIGVLLKDEVVYLENDEQSKIFKFANEKIKW